MVSVGGGVSVGGSVAVGGIDTDGRQAPRVKVMASKVIFPKIGYPHHVWDCFVADAPRNEGIYICRMGL
jgi:hypothetical protein